MDMEQREREGRERRRPCLCREQVVGGSELLGTGISHLLPLWKGNFIALLQTRSKNCCFFQAFLSDNPHA